MRQAESQIAGIQEIFGVCMSAAQMLVPPLSAVYDAQTELFTVVFPSVPGEHYQVQQSVDGITWTVATGGAFVAAEASPETTTEWVSAAVDIDELPIYFRVRMFPRAYIAAPACTTCL